MESKFAKMFSIILIFLNSSFKYESYDINCWFEKIDIQIIFSQLPENQQREKTIPTSVTGGIPLPQEKKPIGYWITPCPFNSKYSYLLHVSLCTILYNKRRNNEDLVIIDNDDERDDDQMRSLMPSRLTNEMIILRGNLAN